MNECRTPSRNEKIRILSNQPYVSITKIPESLMEYYFKYYTTKLKCQITEKGIRILSRVERNRVVEKHFKLPPKKTRLRQSASNSSNIFSSSSSASSHQRPFNDGLRPFKIPKKIRNIRSSICPPATPVSGLLRKKIASSKKKGFSLPKVSPKRKTVKKFKHHSFETPVSESVSSTTDCVNIVDPELSESNQVAASSSKAVFERNCKSQMVSKSKSNRTCLLVTDDEVHPSWPPFHQLTAKEKVQVAWRQTINLNHNGKKGFKANVIRKNENSSKKLSSTSKLTKLSTNNVEDRFQSHIENDRDLEGRMADEEEEVKNTSEKISDFKAKRSKGKRSIANVSRKGAETSGKKQKLSIRKPEIGPLEKQLNSPITNLKTSKYSISKRSNFNDQLSNAEISKELLSVEEKAGEDNVSNGSSSSIVLVEDNEYCGDRAILNMPIFTSNSSCFQSSPINKLQTIEAFLDESCPRRSKSFGDSSNTLKDLQTVDCQNNGKEIVETAFIDSNEVGKYFDNSNSIDKLFVKKEPIQEIEDSSNQEENTSPVMDIKVEDNKTAILLEIKREKEENEKRIRFKMNWKVRAVQHEHGNGLFQIDILDDEDTEEEIIDLCLEPKKNEKVSEDSHFKKENVAEFGDNGLKMEDNEVEECFMVEGYSGEHQVIDISLENESVATEAALQLNETFVDKDSNSELIESILFESERKLVWSSPDSPFDNDAPEEDEEQTYEVNDDIASDFPQKPTEVELDSDQCLIVIDSEVESLNGDTLLGQDNSSEVENSQRKEFEKEVFVEEEKKDDSFEEFVRGSESVEIKLEETYALNNFQKLQGFIRGYFHFMDCQKRQLSNRSIEFLTTISVKGLKFKKIVVKNYQLLQNIDKMKEYFEDVIKNFVSYEKDVEAAIKIVSARIVPEKVSMTNNQPLAQPNTQTVPQIHPQIIPQTLPQASPLTSTPRMVFHACRQNVPQAVQQTFHGTDDWQDREIVVLDQNETMLQNSNQKCNLRNLLPEGEHSSSSSYIHQTLESLTTPKQPCIFEPLPSIDHLLKVGQQQPITMQSLPSTRQGVIVRSSVAPQQTSILGPSTISNQLLQTSGHCSLSHSQLPQLSSTDTQQPQQTNSLSQSPNDRAISKWLTSVRTVASSGDPSVSINQFAVNQTFPILQQIQPEAYSLSQIYEFLNSFLEIIICRDDEAEPFFKQILQHFNKVSENSKLNRSLSSQESSINSERFPNQDLFRVALYLNNIASGNRHLNLVLSEAAILQSFITAAENSNRNRIALFRHKITALSEQPSQKSRPAPLGVRLTKALSELNSNRISNYPQKETNLNKLPSSCSQQTSTSSGSRFLPNQVMIVKPMHHSDLQKQQESQQQQESRAQQQQQESRAQQQESHPQRQSQESVNSKSSSNNPQFQYNVNQHPDFSTRVTPGENLNWPTSNRQPEATVFQHQVNITVSHSHSQALPGPSTSKTGSYISLPRTESHLPPPYPQASLVNNQQNPPVVNLNTSNFPQPYQIHQQNLSQPLGNNTWHSPQNGPENVLYAMKHCVVCLKPAERLCAGCLLIYYCKNHECQEWYWFHNHYANCSRSNLP